MSNRPDTGDADEDKRTSDLLALLYPDPAEEDAEVDASLYEGDEELAGFRDLRAMLADTSDEEPSPAVSNKLLALAAQHAPKAKTESRGVFAWLGNLMMPLVAHPGLAAAATLVLVAGVAGTLYVKGDAQIAEPTADSRGQAPESAVSNEPTAIAPDPELSTPASESLAEEEADEAPTERLEGALEQSADGSGGGRSARGTVEKSKSKEFDKSRKAKPAVVGGSTGYGNQSAKGGSAAADEKREAQAPARSGARTDSLKVKDIDTRDFDGPSNNPSAGNVSAPPPPPKAEAAPSKSTSTSPPAAPSQDSDDAEAETKKSAAQQAASLHEQARIAAKNKDCTRVLALGQQIRKLDGAYYDRKFLSDEALKSCRASANKKGL